MWTELSFLTEGRGRMGWLMEVFSLEKGGRGSAMLNVKQRDVMESRGFEMCLSSGAYRASLEAQW